MLLEKLRDTSDGEVLYHKDIGFPDNIRMPSGFNPVMRLSYGSHSRMEAMAEKYGQLQLPQTLDVRKGDIFEIGVTNGVVTKMAVRLPYDAKKDIVIVIMTDSGFVKTVWANLKTDQHGTLDRTKYQRPK